MMLEIIFAFGILTVALLAGVFSIIEYLNWGYAECDGKQFKYDDGIKGWR